MMKKKQSLIFLLEQKIRISDNQLKFQRVLMIFVTDFSGQALTQHVCFFSVCSFNWTIEL